MKAVLLGGATQYPAAVPVAAVATGCPRLMSLNLCNCQKITDDSLMRVATGCPQLTSLDLSFCEKISDTAVAAVVTGCSRLTSLNLHGCTKITDAAAIVVATGCPQLTFLYLQEPALDDQLFLQADNQPAAHISLNDSFKFLTVFLLEIN